MAKQKTKPTRIIETFLNDLNSMVDRPRFQVILTHGVLELLVNTLIEHRCKNGEKIVGRTRDYPYSVKLVLLHEKGLISDRFYHHLDSLRDLRNKAVHEAQFTLTADMLTPFKGVVSWGKLQKLDDPKNFPHLLGQTVFTLWNTYVKLFAPIFEPHLFQNTDLK
ncbi:MAG TPA: hypothetical protein VMH87_07415 [Pseudomonadales bacterium]|nr:hypothetical protein [Pseudomonadales bacterium]